jgi:hypothetical protein
VASFLLARRGKRFKVGSELGRARENCSVQDVPAGNEAGILKRFATRDIPWIATRRGNAPAFVADSLQFLNQVRAKALSSKWRGHFHVDVAVRTIVMEENISSRCNGAPDSYQPRRFRV